MRNIEFINAGAGSGKTYSLTHKLVEFLKGGNESYKPSEIILTTFTELAAQEFREKSRETLLEEKMYEEAAQLETAAIGTVHSVAQIFLKKYWYLLGRSAQDNVMSENDKQFFINQSLASIATEENIAFFEEMLVVFNFSSFDGKASKLNPNFWKDHLKEIISKMEQYDIADLQNSKDKSREFIDS